MPKRTGKPWQGKEAQLGLECMLNLPLTIGNSGVSAFQRKQRIEGEHIKTYKTEKNLIGPRQTGEEAVKVRYS